jgi:hypothetical protein
MTLAQVATNYYRLGVVTRDNMKVRKTEFITEIILSAFVVIITIQRPGNPSFAVGAIAVIHSLNVARAFEAYKEAKIQSHEPD